MSTSQIYVLIISIIRSFFILLSHFFFNDTATTDIYTLSLHDALPIYWRLVAAAPLDRQQDPSPRLVLHDCGAAPSAAIAASTPSRFALIDERFAEKPEPNPPGD